MSDKDPITQLGEQAQAPSPVTKGKASPSQGQERTQSGRYAFQSPGRREHMLKLHAEGKAFTSGGPRPKHGMRALADRLRRGLDPETPLAVLHAEMKTRYVADLGGEENCSAMELGVCDRMADLDLLRGLLNVQRDGSKNMSLARLEAFASAVSRNAAAYLQAVKTVGPGRRMKEADKTIIVRRFAEPSAPDNGQEGTPRE